MDRVVETYWNKAEELHKEAMKSGAAEKYAGAVQDMYKSWKTVLRCAVGVTEEFICF